MFEFALMADGVAPADLYPLDLPRATRKLDTIKDDLVFWTSGGQSQELIGSGEVAMTMIWNGRAWSAKNLDNKPVEIQWNQQIVTADYLVVPKGSPNKDAAMKFIAYTACAENNAKPSEFIPYGPTNKNSQPNPAMVQDLSVTNADENSAYFDDPYLVDNFAEIDAAWQAWKAS
jgi:putative spermidine/putrescine transport system substrate-binding protein